MHGPYYIYYEMLDYNTSLSFPLDQRGTRMLNYTPLLLRLIMVRELIQQYTLEG